MDSVPAFADSIDPLSVILLAANIPWTLTLSISLFILLAVYYMISGGLVALFSLGPRDINVLKTKQHPPAKRIVSLLEEPKLVYTSVLIAGIVISICIILISAFLINQYLPFGTLKVFNNSMVSYILELLLRVLAIAFVLVFVGEILPKVNATQRSLRFAYTSSFVVELIHLLFKRLSVKMVNVADSISHRLGGDKHMSSASLKELDNELELDENETASEEEKNILRGIIKFPNISVKQIMTSRLDVSGIEWGTSLNQLIQRIEELHYSRLPVYKKSLDDIAGIIHTKDMIPFLDQPDDFDWRPLMRSALYVHEAKLIKDLLKDFQNKRVHFAIVVDEFGGTSGIVTMEDILEEIVGDIQDEFDEEEILIKQVGDTEFVAAGKATLVDLCRGMQLPLDTFEKVRGDSETVAGLVLELAGEFPKQDEQITSADFIFTILSTSKNRIQQVKVEYEKPSR